MNVSGTIPWMESVESGTETENDSGDNVERALRVNCQQTTILEGKTLNQLCIITPYKIRQMS